jgi:hypothetical protein
MNDQEVAKFAKEMKWETKLAEIDAAK